MPLKRTPKKADQLYDDLVHRQTKLVRGMLPPQSIAQRMYPKLKTDAERRREEKSSQQKEKRR
jgi:ribosomal protein L13